MQITPVTGRLFQVTDLLPQELVDRLLSKDWLSAPWQKQEMQSHWLRRAITTDADPVLIEASNHITSLQPQIAELCNIKFNYPIIKEDTVWWLDEPKFTVGMHTDGELPSAMQVYWSCPTDKLGTAFTEFGNRKCNPYKKFVSAPNTGYIMLNCPNPDGSQPLLWHSMLCPVPPGTFRVSSYTAFGAYTDK
jgi:hypothetical protein